MDKQVLKVDNLHYAYRTGVNVLNGINIDIKEGEKIAVIGSNGSGKSTFFMNINGVFIPNKGEITYRGKKITQKNIQELRKHIGIVFQDADTQIVASTVQSEIGFGPMNLKLPKEEVRQRIEEALSYMNIVALKDRAPHYLSGGEKKKVTIADIIAMKSDLIIFDEPMAALDPLNAEMLEEILKKLQEEGKTLMISTHDVDFAYRWSDRILVFYQGEILAEGTPLEIFRKKEILQQANLKKPVILEIYEVLIEKKVLSERDACPKTIKELKALLE